MTGALITAIMLAVVIEAAVEYVSNMVEKNFPRKKIIALGVAMLLAFGAGLDLFAMLEIPFEIPYVGTVFMGIFMSKGANWLHDLFDKLLQWQNKGK